MRDNLKVVLGSSCRQTLSARLLELVTARGPDPGSVDVTCFFFSKTQVWDACGDGAIAFSAGEVFFGCVVAAKQSIFVLCWITLADD